MTENILQDLKNNFTKTFDALKRDLTRVRTGRANVNLLDGIKVSYYGQPTPLSQVANLQVPEARLITIKPWEPNMLKEIERAIQQSDLGLNPNNDGHIIRLQIPSLTEERRKDLAKQVRRYGEDARVAIRNQRRDANTVLNDNKKITEDEQTRALKKVQDATDDAIKQVDTLIATKEKELMEV